MGTRDPRVDAYLTRSAEFARPILTHLRDTVHAVCPEVEETIKWGMPAFMYHGLLCGMAGFKRHCAFGFWKAALIRTAAGQRRGDAMGQFGRITRVSDLPPRRELARYIRKAMRLNETGVTLPRAPRKTGRVSLPADFRRALSRNSRAAANFRVFSPSKRREYVEWIAEAKGTDTRLRRISTSIEWLAEGKSRNWKYER